MRAVLMAGGFGTRLRPITIALPKPMVPLANIPLMQHILSLLKKFSIKEISVLLYFFPEKIKGYFGDGSRFGVTLKYENPREDLETAGSVRFAAKDFDRTFLVMSGDIVTDIDLEKAIDFHLSKRALVTIVLTRVTNPLPFGIVITDDDGRVVKFLEKPTWGEVFSDTINSGIYILEPDVLEFIPERKEFDFSRNLFPILLEKGLPIYGYISSGYWRDIGNIEEYRAAHRDVLSGLIDINLSGYKIRGKRVWLGNRSRVELTARLKGGVIIGEGCVIGGNVKISNSIIGNNCEIREDALIEDSIIWDGVKIGERAEIHESIVCSNVTIGDKAYLSVGTVVSEHCRIGARSFLKANVKVWPYKEVEDDATLASSLIWGEKWSRFIFGSYGVTGIANIEISPEFAAKLGAAFGASVGKNSIVYTSRDSHKTSRMINRAIMTGILSTGVHVHDLGVAPIPLVRFLAGTMGDAGAIHVRKSPFDPELIDIKIFDNRGMDIHPNKEKTIERLFFREDFARATMDETGEISFPIHGIEYYQDSFFKNVDVKAIKEKKFKIIIDYGFGSCARIFPEILGKLGCDVISLNANLDPSKITKTSEEFQRCLQNLSNIVRSLKADVGIMLDAGGEKIFISDETGEILNGDTTLAVMSLYVMRTYGSGTIAIPVTASRVIDEMAAVYNFSVKRTKTSSRSIMELAAEKEIVFAGEQLGGFIFPEFHPAFDGMYASVKLLEMMAKVSMGIHEAIREIPPFHIVHEKLPCPWEMRGKLIRRLIEETKKMNVQLIDGVKIFFNKDWILVLPSQDQSFFNIFAEASTIERAAQLIEEFRGKLIRWKEEEEGGSN